MGHLFYFKARLHQLAYYRTRLMICSVVTAKQDTSSIDFHLSLSLQENKCMTKEAGPETEITFVMLFSASIMLTGSLEVGEFCP